MAQRPPKHREGEGLGRRIVGGASLLPASGGHTEAGMCSESIDKIQNNNIENNLGIIVIMILATNRGI